MPRRYGGARGVARLCALTAQQTFVRVLRILLKRPRRIRIVLQHSEFHVSVRFAQCAKGQDRPGASDVRTSEPPLLCGRRRPRGAAATTALTAPMLRQSFCCMAFCSRRILPDSRLHIMPGVQHHPPAERPETVARLRWRRQSESIRDTRPQRFSSPPKRIAHFRRRECVAFSPLRPGACALLIQGSGGSCPW
jgi:hypothetical protein